VKSSSRSAAPARTSRPGLESLECRALLSATHLGISVPLGLVAGSTVPLTVTALDGASHVATDYTGTIQLTSSDTQALLPGNYTFTAADQGQHTFLVRLQTAGTPTVLAKDTGTATITGSAGVTLAPAPVDHFAVSAAPSAAAGGILNVTVTAQDVFGNTVTNYGGTVHLGSSDPQAAHLADYSFVAGDGGSHTFNAVLKTAGSQTVMVTDSTGATGGTSVGVTPAALAYFLASTSSLTATAGTAVGVNVVARDAFGNTVTNYAGAVHFSSSDPQAMLPADYTFTAADAGAHTFSATPKTAGTQVIAVAVAGAPATQGGARVSVTPAALDHLGLQLPATATAGQAILATVAPQDAFGNAVTGYTGTVHFTATDGKATVPADHAFTAADQGTFAASVTLDTAGPQTVSVTDGSLHGSGTVAVAPGAATHFDVTGNTHVAAGQTETVTVVARDAFGNAATGYRGTATLTVTGLGGPVSDPIAHTFTAAEAGTATLSVALPAKGRATVSVTDAGPPSVSGSLVVTVGDATGSQSYVDSLYQDLLGRPADPASLAAWSALLDAGTSRAAVVRGIENSAEYRADAVTTLYQNLLGRNPDQAGLASFVAQMGGGLSLDGVAGALLSSDEYYQGRGHGTAKGFVSALYQDVLQRAPGAFSQSYFAGLLAQGDARSDVVNQVLTGPEAERLSVRAAYNQFLHRDPDAAGLSSFVALRQQGMTTDDLFATLLASDEYFHNATAL
jgi:hypothetical protein